MPIDHMKVCVTCQPIAEAGVERGVHASERLASSDGSVVVTVARSM